MDNAVFSLLELTKRAVSPWHTAMMCEKRLTAAGFKALKLGEGWNLESGGKYYTKIFGSALIAFTVGQGDIIGKNALRIAAAHTDFPGLRIKPAASMLRDGYGILNIETYGGLILSSWLDRPLSIAGKVVLRGTDAFTPEVRLVDFEAPLVTIPNLAIHMNRKVNEGVAIKKQKEMLPLMAVLGKDGEKDFFESWLARELGISKKEILSYELNLYTCGHGCQLGLAKELISAPRLDNLTSVEACLHGITAAQAADGIRMSVFFDNEEIGSRTKQGAASAILMQILERIYTNFGRSQEELWQAISNGFMLSVDVAHAMHPNYAEKSDPTNRPVLNGGVVLKQAASQSYAGDAEAVAIVEEICRRKGIACQRFVNHSDQPGGSTLGSIASALVPMRTMDIGVGILAMHSARETMGSMDQGELNTLIKEFFTA